MKLDSLSMVHGSPLQNGDKLDLMRAAVTAHMVLGSQAMEGQGCDRHLLGLYAVSEEEGYDLPEIFTDPSFTKRLVRRRRKWKIMTANIELILEEHVMIVNVIVFLQSFFLFFFVWMTVVVVVTLSCLPVF